MADPRPPRSDLEGIADEIAKLKSDVKDLQTPTGTQQENAVAKLRESVADLAVTVERVSTLYDNLETYLDDYIATELPGIVDAKVNARVDAALTAADVTIGRSGGVVRMPSILTTDVSSTTGHVAVWAAGDGRVGNTA